MTSSGWRILARITPIRELCVNNLLRYLFIQTEIFLCEDQMFTFTVTLHTGVIRGNYGRRKVVVPSPVRLPQISRTDPPSLSFGLCHRLSSDPKSLRVDRSVSVRHTGIRLQSGRDSGIKVMDIFTSGVRGRVP